MKKDIRKNIEAGIALGLVCAVILSFSRFSAACENIKDGVLRLHIIANSDSRSDQQLKLTVRDKILEFANENYTQCENLEAAKVKVLSDLEEINQLAEEVIEREGFNYTVTAEIANSYFETREYEDFTLPAGYYESLLIKIGDAKGKNWWCVVFPAVCVPAASDASLSDSVGKDGVKIAENSKKYVVKFKITEWYEQLKRKISK